MGTGNRRQDQNPHRFPFDAYLQDDVDVDGGRHQRQHQHQPSNSSSSSAASVSAAPARANFNTTGRGYGRRGYNPNPPISSSSSAYLHHQAHPHSNSPFPATTSSHPPPSSSSHQHQHHLQLQLPSFLMAGHTPVLAHGGGAEVISSAVAMFPPTGYGAGVGGGAVMGGAFGDMTSAWFVPAGPNAQSLGYYQELDKQQQQQQKQQQPSSGKSTLSYTDEGTGPSSYTYANAYTKRPPSLPFHFEDDPPVLSPTDALTGSDANAHDELQFAPRVAVDDNTHLRDEQLTDNAQPQALLSQSPLHHDAEQHQHQHQHHEFEHIHAYSGLPVYSQSGFDMLSILGRVANRPNPRINLGPVDMTCSFVVVDVRRYDSPIVYASPTFSALTGYAESEVLGRNCRFLQAPGGKVERGMQRVHTSAEAVGDMRRNVAAQKEFQVSLVNYRKDGRPFVNRISIVPVSLGAAASFGGEEGEEEEGNSGTDTDTGEVAFYVGFQVDLNEQPGHIMQRLRDGKYCFNSFASLAGDALSAGERSARAMSVQLRRLLTDPTIHRTLTLANPASSSSNTISTSATSPSTTSPTSPPDIHDELHWLNLLLLEHSSDFVHVLSLKGHFLYVSPSVRRCLGYEAEEMVGRLVTEYCHPADCVPLLRELKGSTAGIGVGAGVAGAGGQNQSQKESDAATPAHGVGNSNSSSGIGLSTNTNTNTTPQDDNNNNASQSSSSSSADTRTVDLLFRIRNKAGAYTWLESAGRLHVEAGKSRKAIVFIGRVRWVPSVRWGDVALAVGGGVLLDGAGAGADDSEEGASSSSSTSNSASNANGGEFWGMMSTEGTFLVASANVRNVLQWGAAEMIGRSLGDFANVGRENSNSSTSHSPSGSDEGASSGSLFQQQLQHHVQQNPDEEIWRLKQALITVASHRLDQGSSNLGYYDAESTSPSSGSGSGARAEANSSNGDSWSDSDPSSGPGKGMKVPIRMQRRDGRVVAMVATLFSSDPPEAATSASASESRGAKEARTCPRPSRCPSVVVKFECAESAQEHRHRHHTSPSTSTSYISSSTKSGSGSAPSSSVSSSSQSHSRPPNANVFEELEPHRETSWQYELQQLKFSNNKLLEEIKSIDASLAAAAAGHGGHSHQLDASEGLSSSNATQVGSQRQQQQQHPDTLRLSPVQPMAGQAAALSVTPVSVSYASSPSLLVTRRLPNPLDSQLDWEGVSVAYDHVFGSTSTSDNMARHDVSSSQSTLGKRTWDASIGRNSFDEP